MSINRGSDNFLLEVALETTSITGAPATSAAIDMSACDDAEFVTEVGTWADGGALTLQLMQDSQADMASGDVKAVKTAKVHATPADGNRFCHQCKAEDMDTESLGAISGLHFRYVALVATAAAGAGTNNVTITSLAFNLRKRYENRAAYTAVDAASA